MEKEDKYKAKEKKKQTKKYLKNLTSETSHPLRNSGRIVKYGFKGFGRNIWLSLASILVMTITLLIIVVSAIANVILNDTAQNLRDMVDITIFLKPETDKTNLKILSDTLLTDKNIIKDSLVYRDAKEEVAIYLDDKKTDPDIAELIKTDPSMYDAFVKNMPAIINFKVYDISDLTSVKNLVATDDLFKKYQHEDIDEYSPTYDMNQTEIATIDSWARIAKTGGIILGAIFLIISILILNNTVRMAIFSRREEIYMMKLIGSSKRFIRGPFIVEAALAGTISGALSATISFLLIEYIAPALENYGIKIETLRAYDDKPIYLVIFFVIVIALGTLIGMIAARLAAKRYLKKL